jgi:ubiquinone/menaquinone biosynthesis C-methylase UbiE
MRPYMKTPYSPHDFWAEVARRYGHSDAEGLAPVLHPDAPLWFNQLIDAAQFRAVLRAVNLASVKSGARILDVGCGTGRWLRRYEAWGFYPTGVDATLPMLSLAHTNRPSSSLVAGESYRLPFADGAFDAVSDITVLQHIPYPLQPQAVSEMLRVTKPGGRLILMELIRGQGAHIFPRPPQEWIRQVLSCQADLIAWFGQEFMLIDRVFANVAHALFGQKSIWTDPKRQPDLPSAPRSTVRNVYWSLRHTVASLSAWTDPMAAIIFPGKVATHGVFVFRK